MAQKLKDKIQSFGRLVTALRRRIFLKYHSDDGGGKKRVTAKG